VETLVRNASDKSTCLPETVICIILSRPVQQAAQDEYRPISRRLRYLGMARVAMSTQDSSLMK
jgi:hypothetical protein